MSVRVYGCPCQASPSWGQLWEQLLDSGQLHRLSLGTYPDTSLKVARERRDDARALIVQGIDPSDVRKASKVQAQTDEADAAREAAGLPQPNSFEHIAREWCQTRRDDWSPTYGQKIMRRLEVDVFPWLGGKPVNAITPPMVLAVLRRVEGRALLRPRTVHLRTAARSSVTRWLRARSTATRPGTGKTRCAGRW